MIADKLKKLVEIKADIKAAVAEITGQDPGNEFSNYAALIRDFTAEEEDYSSYAFAVKSTDPVIQYMQCSKYNITGDNTVDQPAGNWMWENRVHETDYETGLLVDEIDFSYWNRNDYSTGSIVPVNQDATELLHMNWNKMSENGTYLWTFRYMPNLVRVKKFSTGGATNLSNSFINCCIPDLDFEIDMTGVTNCSAMFKYSKYIKKYPRFINAESVTNISEMFADQDDATKTLDFDFSVFSNNLRTIDELFKNSYIPDNMNWKSLLKDNKYSSLSFTKSKSGKIDLREISGNLTENLELSRFFTSDNKTEYENFEDVLRDLYITSCYFMYSYNFSFDDIDVSWMNTSRCSNFSSMFANASVKNINLGEFDISACPHNTSDYGNLGSMFANCDYLKTVTGSFKGLIHQDNFNIAASPLTAESVMVFFNALDPEYPSTIRISATAMANLSDEQKAVATEKGWTIAS